MQRLHPFIFWLVLVLSCFRVTSSGIEKEARNQTELWADDFSDSSDFEKNWTPYGFLAEGIDAKHPLGRSVSGKQSRREWWERVDGALRATNFPEEKHPAGITRRAAGRDIRLSCKIKLPPDGMAQFTIRGDNPLVEKNFHLAVFRVHTHSVAAADNDVIHPKDSAEAAALKARGEWNRKFFIAHTEKRDVTPNVWHHVAIELRGREMKAFLNNELVLTYTTLCGDQPKTSVGLAGGRSAKAPQFTWFDDLRFEPID
jgi:hypothetical protein